MTQPGAGSSRATATSPRRLRIAFISSNNSWGGSEDLWSEAALRLAQAGHSVTAIKGPMEREEPAVGRLGAAGATLIDISKLPLVPARLLNRLTKLSWPLTYAVLHLRLQFALSRGYDLVLVSQGTNLDGLLAGKRVRRRGLRYAILAHKASAFDWPVNDIWEELRAFYRDARACFFVSHANLVLTEEQLGMRLAHAEVVRNPCRIARDAAIDWPTEDGTLRLACVGRFFPREKGQDILLRVLARDKWLARPLRVSFYGSGEYADTLKGMAALLRVEARFPGFAHPAQIWAEHHGLVLPSRAEGLPITVLEAMMCGRIAIVTPAGGTAEAIRHGEDGFVAQAVSEEALDAALEEAWARRDQWQSLGRKAAERARELVPEDPAGMLAARLVHEAESG